LVSALANLAETHANWLGGGSYPEVAVTQQISRFVPVLSVFL
jgi:hypothetical protein